MADVRPLASRFPAWERIAELPTPVRRLEALSSRLGAEVWAKRDDLSHEEIGGNKARKMELLVPAWRASGRTLVAYGPHGSNWLRAAAWSSRRFGLPLRILSFPQPMHAAAKASRARIREWARPEAMPDYAAFFARILLEAPRLLGGTASLAPMGGSSPLTALAYVNAALELGEQVARGEAPRPDVVFVAHGTGGTAAGIVAGLGLLGWPTLVVGVRITLPVVANAARMEREAAAALTLVKERPRLAAFELEPRFYGGQYGLPTPEGRRAAARWRDEEGTPLDLSYTAKAAAALEAWAAEGRLRGRTALFWLTWAPVTARGRGQPGR